MSYPNRTACGVLEEMRDCFKHLNFAPIPGLIEEMQSICNRMESGLLDKGDIESYREELSKIKKKVRNLKQQKAVLEEELDLKTEPERFNIFDKG